MLHAKTLAAVVFGLIIFLGAGFAGFFYSRNEFLTPVTDPTFVNRLLATSPGASTTLVRLDALLSKDSAGVFYTVSSGTSTYPIVAYFVVADLMSFRSLDKIFIVPGETDANKYALAYYADSQHVYVFQKQQDTRFYFDIIEGADPHTFEVVDALSAKDATHSYEAKWINLKDSGKFVLEVI